MKITTFIGGDVSGKVTHYGFFGETIADGVLFEILYAKKLKILVKYYTVDSRVELIKEVSVNELKFEEEVYSSTGLKHEDVIESIK